MEEKRIGKVTHYFTNISVAVLDLEDTLEVGDEIHILGRTTDFFQKVASLQIEHKPIQKAKPGDNVALKVDDHVRENDVIYKVIP
ncbi:MAG: translation elongation factor-like protein [Acidobacteriota bacterium]